MPAMILQPCISAVISTTVRAASAANNGEFHSRLKPLPQKSYPFSCTHRRHSSLLVVFLLFLLLPGFAVAAEFPSRFTAIYAVKKGPITIGETRRSLTPDGPNRFVFESVTRPTGVSRLLRSGQVVERSQWIWHGRHMRPLEYTWFSRGGEKARTLRLAFDWPQRKLTNTVNGDPWQMPLTDDLTVDKLLFQLRLMHDLPTRQRWLHYPVADGGKLKTYSLEILGAETIRIPSGTYKTLRVQRSNGALQTTFWCAEKLGYLPVRIERRKADGSTINAVLTSVTGF